MSAKGEAVRGPGPWERRGDGSTHLGSSHHRYPACGQTPAHYFPPGCPASQPAAGPGSAGQWAQCGASPLSVSAGPGRPDRSEAQEGTDQSPALQSLHDSTCPCAHVDGPYHQLLVNDHLADDGVHSGQVQFKHVR